MDKGRDRTAPGTWQVPAQYWSGGWMGGWMDGRMDGWADAWADACVHEMQDCWAVLSV